MLRLFSNNTAAKTLSPGPKVAIVVSEFNKSITHKLLEGAEKRLHEISMTKPYVLWAPGAVEIPLLAQKLAYTRAYEAIVALAAVIRGETSHYDYVCQQVSMGCQTVSLQSQIPVIFGVLTTDNVAQALDRVGGRHGHKGREAVDTAVHMIRLLRALA